jgi:hypothetical protein
MLEVKSTGMGHLEVYLKELQDASAALHLNLILPDFDPATGSVDAAIAKMEAIVDERVAPWKHNQTVLGMAQEAKKRFRAELLKKAGTV